MGSLDCGPVPRRFQTFLLCELVRGLQIFDLHLYYCCYGCQRVSNAEINMFTFGIYITLPLSTHSYIEVVEKPLQKNRKKAMDKMFPYL